MTGFITILNIEQLKSNISVSPMIIGSVTYGKIPFPHNQVEISVDDKLYTKWPICKETGNFRGLVEIKKTGETKITFSYHSYSVFICLQRRHLLFRNHVVRPVVFLCNETNISYRYQKEINKTCNKLS